MVEDKLWKRRFQLFMGARLLGLMTFLVGLAVMFTDVLRTGGWPAVGVGLMILGLIDSVVLPLVLSKRWKRSDSDE